MTYWVPQRTWDWSRYRQKHSSLDDHVKWRIAGPLPSDKLKEIGTFIKGHSSASVLRLGELQTLETESCTRAVGMGQITF